MRIVSSKNKLPGNILLFEFSKKSMALKRTHRPETRNKKDRKLVGVSF